MPHLSYPVGITSVTRSIFIQDNSVTTGVGLAGLTHSSAGLIAYYRLQGQSAWTAITLVAATLGTYTDSGFVEEDATHALGRYEIGIPDACFTSAGFLEIQLGGATHMAPVIIDLEVDALEQYYPDDKLYFDSNTGTGGAVPGVNGTIGNPCNAEADIISLIGSTNLKSVWVTANSTYTNSTDPGAVHFESPSKFSGTFAFAGVNATGTTFKNLKLTNPFTPLTAPITLIEDCAMPGTFVGTPLNMLKTVFGNITLDVDGQDLVWWACYSNSTNNVVNMNHLTSTIIVIELWSGWVYLTNLVNNSQVFCIGDGIIGLQNSCTGGFCTPGGTMLITDNSGGGGGGAVGINSVTGQFGGTFGLIAGQPCNAFPFLMYDTSGNLVPGKSPVGEISINGGAYAALTNSPGTSVGDGGYVIDISAADIPANPLPFHSVTVLLKFTAAGCKDTVLPVILQQLFTPGQQ